MRLPDRIWRAIYKLGFPVRQWLRRRLGLERGGACVAIRSTNDVLVIRHSYRPGLDFPGGGLVRGERLARTAVRELEEETGLVVEESAIRDLGIVRRGFRGAQDRQRLFELRVSTLPDAIVDRREVVWAGPLRAAGARWHDLQMPVRWYLRRHAPELLPPAR